MIRIIATADNHLGQLDVEMSAAAQQTRHKYLRRAFNQVCEYALAKNADGLVIAGDLFDSAAPSDSDTAEVARRLNQLKEAGIRVFAVAGRHDAPLEGYAADGLLTLFPQLDGATRTPAAETLAVRGQTLVIGGFSPDAGSSEGGDPLENIVSALPSADWRVLVGHFAVEGWASAERRESTARQASLEGLRGVDLVIAGGRHSHQTDQLGSARVVVPGASECLDFDSPAVVPGFVDIVFDAAGEITVRHVATIPQPRQVIALGPQDLAIANPSQYLAEQIKAVLEGLGPDALVQVSLSGLIDPHIYSALSYAEVAEQVRGQLCHLAWNAASLRPKRAAGLRRLLAEDIRAAVAELAQAAPAEDQALLPDVERELLAVIEGREER